MKEACRFNVDLLMSHLYYLSTTLHYDQFMAFLMDQQFTVYALVSLPAQAPDTICADGTMSTLYTTENKGTINYTEGMCAYNSDKLSNIPDFRHKNEHVCTLLKRLA